MVFQNKTLFFNEFKFVIHDHVYEPAEDSFLFAEKLDVKQDERVLDMGVGCGILGLLSTKKAKEVVGIDINPFAVRCAKGNAVLNNVKKRISFIQGDLFSPIKKTEKFDLILFNAPYLPEVELNSLTWIERAWFGGLTGRKVIDAFLSEVINYLSKKGRILLLQSTLSNLERTIFRFVEYNLKTKIIAKTAVPFFETIALIEATH